MNEIGKTHDELAKNLKAVSLVKSMHDKTLNLFK